MPPKRVVQVASTPKPKTKDSLRLLARLCYFYPQYTLAAARKLPAKYVVLLLKEADRMEAARYFNLTQIAAAPHTKKGAGVDKLTKHFRELMNG